MAFDPEPLITEVASHVRAVTLAVKLAYAIALTS